MIQLHLCSPFLWVYGCPPSSSCLWSRWMPPTSWSGLEDAGGPEEEGGSQSGGGRGRERASERCRGEHMQRLVSSRSSWKPSWGRRCLWLSVMISEIHTHLHHSYCFTLKDGVRCKRATLTRPVSVPAELRTFWSESGQTRSRTLVVGSRLPAAF